MSARPSAGDAVDRQVVWLTSADALRETYTSASLASPVRPAAVVKLDGLSLWLGFGNCLDIGGSVALEATISLDSQLCGQDLHLGRPKLSGCHDTHGATLRPSRRALLGWEGESGAVSI